MTIKEKLLEKMSAQCGQKITEINLISWDMIEPYINELEASQLEPLVIKKNADEIKKALSVVEKKIHSKDIVEVKAAQAVMITLKWVLGDVSKYEWALIDYLGIER